MKMYTFVDYHGSLWIICQLGSYIPNRPELSAGFRSFELTDSQMMQQKTEHLQNAKLPASDIPILPKASQAVRPSAEMRSETSVRF